MGQVSPSHFLSSLPEAMAGETMGVADGFFFPMPSPLGSFVAGCPAASRVRSSLGWASREGAS